MGRNRGELEVRVAFLNRFLSEERAGRAARGARASGRELRRRRTRTLGSKTQDYM
jgi:hypothetical protein